MSERIHPRERDSDSPISRRWTHHGQSSSHESGSTSNQSSSDTTGTYIVQVKKDIIIPNPTAENAEKNRTHTNRRNRRRTCRQCCCASFCLLILLVLLLTASSAIFYLIYRPKSPSFSIEHVSIKGINVTTSSTSFSPAFNVTIRTSNPHKKVGFYYEPGSAIAVYHEAVKLGGGDLPAFYQAPGNVTVFSTVLLGGEIVVSDEARKQLAEEQKDGRVPLKVYVGLPMKVRVGKLTSWKVTVKVACDVAVSALTALADVVSKDCSVDFKPW